MIYVAVLDRTMRQLALDTLVVDPRPRFLIEEAGGFIMGEYSMFGDPRFMDAIRDSPGVVDCRMERGRGCDKSVYRRLGTVSEIVVVGPREAGVLASFADLRTDPIGRREIVMHLRFTDGVWRVVRTLEGNAVNAARAARLAARQRTR